MYILFQVIIWNLKEKEDSSRRSFWFGLRNVGLGHRTPGQFNRLNWVKDVLSQRNDEMTFIGQYSNFQNGLKELQDFFFGAGGGGRGGMNLACIGEEILGEF